MNLSRHTAAAVGIAFALALSACGGSDDAADATPAEEVVADDAQAEEGDTASDADTPELVSVEVPADWDTSIPAGPLDAMTRTYADIRGDGDFVNYEVGFQGRTPDDQQDVFDQYEALALDAGWEPAAEGSSLVASYALDDRTLSITVSTDGVNTFLAAAVIPN